MLDLGKAVGALIFSVARFETLWDLLEDKAALKTHFDTWHFKSMDATDQIISRPITSLNPTLITKVEGNYHQEISDARLHYGNLMLVTAYTYLEDNVASFFYEVFLKKPQVMIEYIRRDAGNLSVPLSVFIEKEKNEILSQLAREQSSKATNGDIHKVCKRIKIVSGFDVPKKLQDTVSELQKKRNDIVHEAKMLSLDRDEVANSFDIVREMLVTLARAAQSLGIDIDDPAHLLGG
jgi:hypothetical protein